MNGRSEERLDVAWRTSRMAIATAAALLVVMMATPARAQVAADAARAATVGGPLAGVPSGQMLVVHIPDAARVLAEGDRILSAAGLELSENPLRKRISEWRLGQALRPGASVTLCDGPPVRLGGPPTRTVIVRGVDVASLVGEAKVDADGIYRREPGPWVMMLAPGTAVLGDEESLRSLEQVGRGVALTAEERETLTDADVMVWADAWLLLSQWEARYEAARALLAAQAAQARREGSEDEEKAAEAQSRLVAVERLWRRGHEVRAVAAGLLLDRGNADMRLCVRAQEKSALADALGGQPALAGELNPPLPSEPFAAIGYARFDPERGARLAQWWTDAAAEMLLAVGGEQSALGPPDLEAMHKAYAEWPAVLAGRVAGIVPLASPKEPVAQFDVVSQLKPGDEAAAKWRQVAPPALDGVVMMANALQRAANRGRAWYPFITLTEAAPKASAPATDVWRAVHPAREQKDATTGSQLMNVVLGPAVSVWEAASNGYGYLSSAPSASRLRGLMARQQRSELGQAGDDERTREALRHALRRSNVVVISSPSVVMQMVSRGMVDAAVAKEEGEAEAALPLANDKPLAILSLRAEEASLSGRLYVPASQLLSAISDWRTLASLREGGDPKGAGR